MEAGRKIGTMKEVMINSIMPVLLDKNFSRDEKVQAISDIMESYADKVNGDKFIYNLGTDKAYLVLGGEKKEVACFDVKWQSPDISGVSRTWYWPTTKGKRRKAQEILNKTGQKPHIDTL